MDSSCTAVTTMAWVLALVRGDSQMRGYYGDMGACCGYLRGLTSFRLNLCLGGADIPGASRKVCS